MSSSIPIQLTSFIFTIRFGSRFLMLLAIGASLWLSSCSGDNCLQTTGEIQTYSRTADSVFQIEISDVFDVVLVPDTTNIITVTCGANLYDGIIFEESDGKLSIKNSNTCNFLRSDSHLPVLTIYSNQINNFRIPGNVTFSMPDTLTCDSFEFAIYGGINTVDLKLNTQKLVFSMNGGTGDYRVSGNAGLFYFYFFGTGFFWGENLTSDLFYGQHRSTGDIHLNVLKEMNLRLYSIGDAYYYTETEVINFDNSEGSGQLIPLISN